MSPRITAALPLLLLTLLLCCRDSAAASAFDGLWEVRFSCDGATGVYAERCRQGQRDGFQLNLWSSTSRLCGLHMATAYLGNRVDEAGDPEDPSVQGALHQGFAIVHFRSSWGGQGSASLQRRGRQLVWQILAQDPGGEPSWLPQRAVLSRKPGHHTRAHPPCPA